MKEILQTERLHLRQFTKKDAPFIIELLNTETFIKFIGDKKIKTIADAENYLTVGPLLSYKENGFGLWLFCMKGTNLPIGMCGLIKRESLPYIDIGYAMLPAYEGKGYAFEIANAVMDYGKKTLQLKKIIAITTKKNERSVHLLKKLGLHFEKKIRLGEDKEDLMQFG